MTALPQMCWLVFCAGMLLSFLLGKQSRMAGILFACISASFLYTALFNKAPKIDLYAGMMTAFAVALTYYWTRATRFQEHDLRFFLIPAVINILFVFLTAVFPKLIPLRSEGVCGLLGAPGLTATFLSMTTPIFLRYFKPGLFALAAAILLCQGETGFLAFMVCLIFHYRKERIVCAELIIITFLLIVWGYMHEPHAYLLRLSMMAGALSGIFHHPFLGWGMGSFVNVMASIPPSDSVYFGVPFNTEKFLMNHPTNEFLFGWWNFGLLFLLSLIAYTVEVFKGFQWHKTMTFEILLCGFVVMMFFMFTPPTLFLMALALGVYENQKRDYQNLEAI